MNKIEKNSSIQQQTNSTSCTQHIKYNQKLTQFGCNNTQIYINTNHVRETEGQKRWSFTTKVTSETTYIQNQDEDKTQQSRKKTDYDQDFKGKKAKCPGKGFLEMPKTMHITKIQVGQRRPVFSKL